MVPSGDGLLADGIGRQAKASPAMILTRLATRHRWVGAVGAMAACLLPRSYGGDTLGLLSTP